MRYFYTKYKTLFYYKDNNIFDIGHNKVPYPRMVGKLIEITNPIYLVVIEEAIQLSMHLRIRTSMVKKELTNIYIMHDIYVINFTNTHISVENFRSTPRIIQYTEFSTLTELFKTL